MVPHSRQIPRKFAEDVGVALKRPGTQLAVEVARCHRIQDGRVIHSDNEDAEKRDVHSSLKVPDVAKRRYGKDNGRGEIRAQECFGIPGTNRFFDPTFKLIIALISGYGKVESVQKIANGTLGNGGDGFLCENIIHIFN